MFPGRSAGETQAEMVATIADPKMTVEAVPPVSPSTPVPTMDPQVTGPIERLAAKHYPGVPVIPTLFTAATDGRYLAREGIPSYGVPGLWTDPDGNGTHGFNERPEVRALIKGRDYLYDLVKALAD
jgi:acetylornithine deacetylase/succinyl-diaminopimelate desuccinylase-like protein